MALLPPALVAGVFLVACLTALAFMIYTAWRGSKPSGFFMEAVADRYDLDFPETEIDGYYDLKDKLQAQVEAEAPPGALVEGPDGAPALWAHRLPQEERLGLHQALMRRLVKDIERLDKVQRDKPGTWKLWQKKLVSEEYWNSIIEAEKQIGEEVDFCLAEADELEPGWREHIFQQAVQIWRMEKGHVIEKQMQKKAVQQVKKEKVKEVRRAVTEVKVAAEEKIRQEKNAEKAMEKLLREEELAEKAAAKKAKEKAAAKPKAKKK